ncbi:MAG: hypothetical protein AAFP16_10395 [Pseudomonadota bacterium]
MRICLTLCALCALTACTSPISRATQPTGPELPPIGIQATAVWLEEREAVTVAAARARSEELRTRAVAAPSRAVAQTQSASGQTVSVPDRPRPSTRRGRAVQAFADVCVASISDINGIASRMNAVNIRDFDRPARVNSDNTGAQLLSGGIDDGPIRLLVGLNPNGTDTRALCSISTIGSNARATAQAKIDTVTAAGFRLEKIASQGRGQQRFRIVGAPDGTILSIRTNVFGAGASVAWR